MQHAIPKLLDIPICRRIHSGRAARMCIVGCGRRLVLTWMPGRHGRPRPCNASCRLITSVDMAVNLPFVRRRTSRLSPLCGSMSSLGMTVLRECLCPERDTLGASSARLQIAHGEPRDSGCVGESVMIPFRESWQALTCRWVAPPRSRAPPGLSIESGGSGCCQSK